MDEIKLKLKSLFELIDNENNLTLNKIINESENIFKNEYTKVENCINQAYYYNRTIGYYINNSNGIYFMVSIGPGERLRPEIGDDDIVNIYTGSQFSRNKEIKDGIDIICHNNYTNNKLSDRLNDFFDLDLSWDNILNNKNNYIFNTLSNELKNNDNIVEERFKNMKNEAVCQNRNEKSYEEISPYGGYDVTVHEIPELLLKSISEFKSDDYFYTRAISLFEKEYGDYLNKNIEVNEQEDLEL